MLDGLGARLKCGGFTGKAVGLFHVAVHMVEPYYRARRRGWPTHYFKATPGTEEFAEEYQRWLHGETSRSSIGERRTTPGSISALIARAYSRSEWAGHAPSTQATYRGWLERFRAQHGHRLWGELTKQRVRLLIEAKPAAPAAANNMLRMLRMLAGIAIDERWTKIDPTEGIKPIAAKGDGFHEWTEAEIAAFEARWPIGTKPRLALALLLCTGQRRSDIVRLGRQHERQGRLDFKQQKTRAEMSIPIFRELRAVLDASTTGDLTYLVTSYGASFTAAGFGNWFRECCNAAGLSQCSAHGLRKAAARRLAEAGCSTHEIASITGHKTLKEIERYTKKVAQAKLAGAAMRRVEREQNGG